MSNVCLINTSGETKHTSFVPLALLKFATKHKANGDHVEYFNAGRMPSKKPDIIYFSTIFGFKKNNDIRWINGYAKAYPKAEIKVGGVSATINYDFFKENTSTNCNIHKGLLPELDNYVPDYNIAGLNYSYGFTTRGCGRKCDWCCVPKIEGLTYPINEWKKTINKNHKYFYAFDNNILFSKANHVKEVMNYIAENDMKIEFNQAMDAELFVKRKDIYEIFLQHKTRFKRFLFSWDSERCTPYINEVMKLLQPFKTEKNTLWYMLYDRSEEQTPKRLLEKIQYIFTNFKNVEIKPMRFIDIKTGTFPREWGTIGDLFAKAASNPINMTGIIGSGFYKCFFDCDYKEFIKRCYVMQEWKRISFGKYHTYKEFFEYYKNLTPTSA